MYKKGFTLIELLMVIIIIAILASISVPIFRDMSRKAMAQEAVTMMSTIMQSERFYFLEHGEYVLVGRFNHYLPLNDYLDEGELDGKYFGSDAFYTNTEAFLYYKAEILIDCLTACSKDGSIRNWPTTDGREGLISIDEKGNIYSNLEGLGYPNVSTIER